MKNAILLLFCFFQFSVFGQPGSAGSPFTALGNARTVTTAGIYYFNLDGTTFSTYVSSSGMVLVATDLGGGPGGSLPQVTALTNTGRGILSPAVLSTLTSATEASYTTSSGAIDVTSTDASILSRITNNASLHRGVNDIAINAGWTGTGQARVRGASANCTSSSGTTLNANLHHPCGDATSFHWIPASGIRREVYNSGGESSGIQFNLWVGAPVVALPVTLTAFKADLLNNNDIKLSWITTTETNSGYFLVESSADRLNWMQVAKLNAHNHSSLPRLYTITDDKPASGDNFYRLKIVDLDGATDYSDIVRARITTNKNHGTIYPNPARNLVFIYVRQREKIKVFNAAGADVTGRVNLLAISNSQYSLDLSNVPKGIYVIRGERFSKKIVME